MMQSFVQKLPWSLLLACLLLLWLSLNLSPALATAAEFSAHGRYTDSSLPSLAEFRQDIQNGNRNALVGVYVPERIAAPIVQQPSGNLAYVSTNPDVVTQFRLAASYKTIGLLAHNYLLGETFDNLRKGQRVILVYGDGSVKTYVISKTERYQALSPTSPYSSFKDLENPDVTLSVEQVFRRVYGAGDRVVFQTCLEQNGNESWGRLFITAQPLRKDIARNWFRVFSKE